MEGHFLCGIMLNPAQGVEGGKNLFEQQIFVADFGLNDFISFTVEDSIRQNLELQKQI